MSNFKAKMHKIQFRLGLHPRPSGSLQCSPDSLAGFKGPISKGGEGRGKGWMGNWRERREWEEGWGIGLSAEKEKKEGRVGKGQGGGGREGEKAIPPRFLSHFKPCAGSTNACWSSWFHLLITLSEKKILIRQSHVHRNLTSFQECPLVPVMLWSKVKRS